MFNVLLITLSIIVITVITVFIVLKQYLGKLNLFEKASTYLDNKFVRNGLHLAHLNIDKHTNLSYWEGGKGPALVLIHGFGAPAKYQWDRQLSSLVGSYRLIIPNLVYFGESNSESNQYSPQFQAQCIANLLDHLKIDTFCATGISYGGVVAVLLANIKADKIKKLAICDSPIRFFTEQHIEATLNEFGVDSVEDLLVPDHKEALVGLSGIAFYKSPPIPKFVLEDAYKGLVLPQAAHKKQLLSYLFKHRKELSAIEFEFSCPVLLIWGKYDKLIPKEIGEQLLAYFGTDRARLEIIDNAAHMPNLEQASVFNALLIDFLNQAE